MQQKEQEKHMAKPKHIHTIQWIIYLFFLLSGATGLIYEVIWARLLGLNFGNTMYAISLVLATFMGGLALGSFVVIEYLKRYSHSLRIYAILELGIGLWALFVPEFLKSVENLYASLFPMVDSWLLFSSLALVRFGLSILILLVPAMLMGGTLPVLTTYFTKNLQQVGRKLSLLYTLNTLGAVMGVWWVGFYALPWLGIKINLVIGALCLWFDYKSEELPAQAEIPEAQPPAADLNPKLAVFLVAGIFVAGFSAMVYEISWTRALIMVLGSSTYAFSCILMAFLLGIALGSFIYNLIGRKISLGIFGFCLIEILIGVFCLLSLPAFSLLPRTYVFLYYFLPSGDWIIQGLRFSFIIFSPQAIGLSKGYVF
jgi:spermidine synthase